MRDIRIRDYCVVVRDHLLDGRSLVSDVDGVGWDAMDNHSVGRHNEFRMLPEASEPPFVILKSYSFSCRTGDNLYISAL